MIQLPTSLGAIEEERLKVQTEIDAVVSPSERNRIGQFATPPALARSIVRCARPYLPFDRAIHFCDPALGTGAFFGALLTEFGQEGIQSATGIELQPAIARAADRLWKPYGLRVVVGDFANSKTLNGLPRPNLVITNPPYVRHHHLDQERKLLLGRELLRRAKIKVSGLAGFYVYYLLLATEWMEDAGVGAWLVPSEFMEVNYGRALREYLTSEVQLLRVHRFDPMEVQFDDALVSSVVVFLSKTRPESQNEVAFTFGGSIEAPAVEEAVSLSRVRQETKWTRHPLRGVVQAGTVVHAGTEGQPSLGDCFIIRRGIATGANEFFILPRDKARSLGLPSQYLKAVLPSPRKLNDMIIRADSEGYAAVEPQLVLIDCKLPEHEIRESHPQLWNYLVTAEELDIKGRYLLSQRSPWYRQEEREPPPFFCTYMGRANSKRPLFRFIWNQSRAIATNLYLLMYPKGPLKALFAERPHFAEVIFEALNSIESDALRHAGRVYGGGLQKLEPRELAQVSADSLCKAVPDLIRYRDAQFAL